MANEDSEYTTESDTSSEDEAQIGPLSQSTVQGIGLESFGVFRNFLEFFGNFLNLFDNL